MESPRLASYLKAASDAKASRSRAAWNVLTSSGLPLVEVDGRDGHKVRVTFVWRPERPGGPASIYTPIANPVNGEMDLLPLGGTGAWFRTFVVPRKTRALYAFSPRPTPTPRNGGDWGGYFRSLVPDPYNLSRLTMAKDPDDPRDVEVTVSVLALPGAPRQPWVRARRPPGWGRDHARLRSRYLDGSRSVWVFVPPGFRPENARYNLVIAFDGVAYQSAVPSPTILENLVAAGRVDRSVLVLVGNAPGAREAELLHNPKFVRFLSIELVPWLRRRYHLRLSAPNTVLVGSSLGGLTAAFAALQHPELFGNVLAQSGAFTWSESGGLLGSPSLMEEFARAPRQATRFYLDAGTLETAVHPGTQVSLLAGVRHLRDVLSAKGYTVKYAEFEGGHDYACWAGTLADGLQFLLGRKDGGPRSGRSDARAGGRLASRGRAAPRSG